MKKIALLTHESNLITEGPQGGSSVSLLDDYRILLQAGWDVTIWGAKAPHSYPIQQIPVHLPSPRLANLEYCVRFVRANPSGILLAHDVPNVAMLAPTRSIIRFSWEGVLPRYWRMFWASRSFQRANYLFLSHAARSRWCGRHRRIPVTQTHVIWNSVDLRLFAPRPRQGDHCRVGFASQWTPVKGLGVLVAAWEEVRRQLPHAELWLAGGTDLWQRRGATPQQELNLAKAVEGMRDKGVRVLGIMPRKELPTFWSQVDLACVPSTWNEQFGRVALEAMACGRAVVVSDSEGLPEVVADAGAVVPRGDPKALANALIELLRTPSKRKDMEDRARRRAQMFSPQRRATELVALVEELAKRATKR